MPSMQLSTSLIGLALAVLPQLSGVGPAEWLQPLQPPLVALDITPGRGTFLPYFTLGGLDTLPTGEVVDPQRQVIPGLYAAGRTACGVVRRAEGYSSGMSVGDASYSGRMAGKQAAARQRK